ncbi:M1 family metallopeptidase [Streptomyces sp. NPDC059740]|uniref:M1 family metallopeptidase n=1 Tax=Streptomyces sp. NPDC059740 TaxID=3346926 RepID=UPI00364D8969
MRQRYLVPGAAALCLLLAAPAFAATPEPGAPGMGDPYYPDYGNGGYDVSHYDLRLAYQPKTDQLDGTATLTATTTQDLSRFDLDFALDVSSVLVDGHRAAFARSGDHELQITPAQPLAKGQEITVVVRYSGVPSSVQAEGFTSWQRTPDGGVAANEPESAWWWFPSNDHPRDKATYDVSVTVPDGTQAISNGTLQSTSSQLGRTRYNWREDKPQATYLATLAVGRFDITTGKTDSGIPVTNAVSKDLGANTGAAKASVGRTSEIIDWESTLFGPYPFSAVGGYVPNVPTHYAVETQTRPFYSPAQFADGANPSVIVHELAHQWFGDCVSVENWRDIWVNEGFATYAQWLWSEKEGEGSARDLAAYTYAQHPADDAFWTVKPGDPGADKQFDDAVYDRGAMALQALRQKTGDKVFFKILRSWTTERRYGNGSVQDFRRLASRVSGKDLGRLFTDWLFTPARPKAPASWQPDAAPRSTLAGPVKPKSWEQIRTARTGHRAAVPAPR